MLGLRFVDLPSGVGQQVASSTGGDRCNFERGGGRLWGWGRGARIVTRTWQRDAFMNSVAQKYVLGKQSLVHRVQHSYVWKTYFQTNVAKQKDNPTSTRYIRSLSMAPHRWDSTSKPFCRVVVFLEAYLATCQQLADQKRGSAEGREAVAFLEQISEEELIMLGLLADSGEETIALTRFLDNEDFDKSALAPQLNDFVSRIHLLFVDGDVLTMQSSFTAHVLGCLKQRRTLFLTDRARSLGGPQAVTAGILARCMERIRCWVSLAHSVVRAEFPNFEILQAFAIFELAGSRPAADDILANIKQVKAWTERFCKLLSLNYENLVVEFEEHQPIAKRIYDVGGFTSFEAWAEAVRTTQSDKRRRARYPVDNLRCLLFRFGAYAGSTSGVERLFAACKGSAGVFRADLGHQLINDELQLLSDIDKKNDKQMIEKAMEIWSQIYHAARDSSNRPLRLHAGKRLVGGTKEKPSLCKWLKRRREEVSSLTASKKRRVTSGPAPEVVGCGGWTAAHKKEKDFQDAKRLERFMQAVDENYTVGAENSAGAEAAWKLWKDFGAKRAATYSAEKMRLGQKSQDPTLNVKSMSNVFVDPAVDFQGDDLKFTQALRQHCIKRTYNRLSADVFVVPNVAQLGQRIQWCTMLVGSCVCDLKCLISGGTGGNSVTFKPAVSSRRMVWCSDNFKASHGELHNILCHIVALPVSNWKWLATKEQMLERAKKRAAGGHAGEVVAFITSAEQMSEDMFTCHVCKSPALLSIRGGANILVGCWWG